MNLIFPETRVIGLHFLPLIVWVELHSNLCSELQKTYLSATECWPKTDFDVK